MSAELIPWFDRVRKLADRPPDTLEEMYMGLSVLVAVTASKLGERNSQGYRLVRLTNFSMGYDPEAGHNYLNVEGLLQKTDG